MTEPSLVELDYQHTAIGELILRRRRSPSLDGGFVYEVKLNGEFLMSSVATVSEEALAELALAEFGESSCDVLIGGLGLGYTAAAALRHFQVRRVDVVEFLQPVIDWHRNRLVPVAEQLLGDSRCRFIHDDFFDYVRDATQDDARRYGIILLDIDHSPESWLHPAHKRCYGPEGLRALAEKLNPNGVFALWSAAAPDERFLTRMQDAFAKVCMYPVDYFHPTLHSHEQNTVIVARR
ncbi:MAG: hypothetical protein WD768_12070 [Phycisphaeraceae bacterium]